jgi:hypothetical protein
LQELAGKSQDLRLNLALEQGQDLGTAQMTAYQQLQRGQFAQAQQSGQENPQSWPRLLRLLAASDGASPELVRKALALPDRAGLDQGTLWSSVALAMRQNQDPSPLLQALPSGREAQAKAVMNFLQALRKNGGRLDPEPWLAGLTPELRGQAYNAAVILLGNAAPRAWRDMASKLLFVTERPYYG